MSYVEGGGNVTLQRAVERLGELDTTAATSVLCLGDAPADTVTRGELVDDARRHAASLAHAGIGAGDCVIIARATSREFFGAFWGTVLRGAVPVPLAPPGESLDDGTDIDRYRRVVDITSAQAVWVDPTCALSAELEHHGVRTLIPASSSHTPAELMDRTVTGDDVAFIQFTSGSTRDPHGCVITHDNAAHNLECLMDRLGFHDRPAFHGLNWCPLHHDMGLVGAVVLPVYSAHLISVHTTPIDFLLDPLSWVRLMSEYKAEISAAPNVGFALVAKRAARAKNLDLDLSHMRHIFNGAEPIRPDIVRSFNDALAPYGLADAVVHPAYGLAEQVVIACSHPGGLATQWVSRMELSGCRAVPAAPHSADAVESVSLGTPIDGLTVKIVNADGNTLGECEVGDIFVRSPSTMRGYMGEPPLALTSDGWAATGDTGYLSDGELYLVGRTKDIIIQGGANIIPSDLEWTITNLPSARAGGVAVIGVAGTDATEHLVALVEVSGAARDQLTAATREAISVTHRLSVRHVVLLDAGQLPRTTSGKIRRAEARERFLAGAYGDVPPWALT